MRRRKVEEMWDSFNLGKVDQTWFLDLVLLMVREVGSHGSRTVLRSDLAHLQCPI